MKETIKVYSTWVDAKGGDAGTIFVCATSPEEANTMIRQSDLDYDCHGDLHERKTPCSYWPSETFAILGNAEELLIAVDEQAEEERREAELKAWQLEQLALDKS